MKRLLSNSLMVAALTAGLSLASTPANAAFLDFTVVESTVPGALPNIQAPSATGFIADKLNGGYSEVLTFTGGGNFITNAFAEFTAYRRNEGANNVVAQVNGLGANNYNVYATFASAGTVSGNNFTGTSADVRLYIDANQDTTKTLGATGADPITLGNTSDDYLILSTTTLLAGSGVIVPGTGGFFDLLFGNPVLTANNAQSGGTGIGTFGRAYWPDLPLLNLRANVDGDFDEFVIPATGTVFLTGDLSNVFQDAAVPEPATVGLLGLGLLATVWVRRRRQA
jgi:hypothetical protein